jgi:hypothetical protein
MPEETITITKIEHDRLLKDSDFLEALRQAGVDNWDGYDYAFEIIERWEKEDKLKNTKSN